ncbi:MAG: Kdo hydroxylase family protein [Methylococcaceae bacterium]
MALDIICERPFDRWGCGSEEPDPAGEFEQVLESGQVLYLPRLSFAFEGSDRRFLSEHWSDGKAKNISYRGAGTPIHGAQGMPQDMADLTALIARFCRSATDLVHTLFPHYRGHLTPGYTSYRTAPAAGRVTSWRKDDTRLHVDSFPSNPTGGLRLLRVFTNVNPAGEPRVWRVGEPFSALANRFFAKASAPIPGAAWLLEHLGITKARRTDYDHYMGQLHDLGKADLAYQQTSPQRRFEFPPGATWLVFSDQVQHAVMAGQYMLEQTFYLDPDHLLHPQSGPLSILESLAGRPLR